MATLPGPRSKFLKLLRVTCIAQLGLNIKESSRGVLALKGADMAAIDPKWCPSPSLAVLGHNVARDAGIRSEWLGLRTKLRKILWKILVANPGVDILASIKNISYFRFLGSCKLEFSI